MAEGISMLTELGLLDLAGTLATVATGLTAIANSGIASAGPGLQQAGDWVEFDSYISSTCKCNLAITTYSLIITKH